MGRRRQEITRIGSVLSCDFEGEVGVDTLALASVDVGEHCTGCIRERSARIEHASKQVHE
jgi:hypothetical protein